MHGAVPVYSRPRRLECFGDAGPGDLHGRADPLDDHLHRLAQYAGACSAGHSAGIDNEFGACGIAWQFHSGINVPLAIGSGWMRTNQVVCYGAILMAVSIVTAAAIGYPIGSALMGV